MPRHELIYRRRIAYGADHKTFRPQPRGTQPRKRREAWTQETLIRLTIDPRTWLGEGPDLARRTLIRPPGHAERRWTSAVLATPPCPAAAAAWLCSSATKPRHGFVEACGQQECGPRGHHGAWTRRSRLPGRLSATAGRFNGAARAANRYVGLMAAGAPGLAARRRRDT